MNLYNKTFLYLKYLLSSYPQIKQQIIFVQILFINLLACFLLKNLKLKLLNHTIWSNRLNKKKFLNTKILEKPFKKHQNQNNYQF